MLDLIGRILTHPCALLLLGGGCGANARYWIGTLFVSREWSTHFPWHTFLINIAGSLLLGMIGVSCRNRPEWFLLLGTGFCGGFTTFSTFSIETLHMLEKGRTASALVYVLGSACAAVFGAWLGMRLMRPA